MKKRHNNSWPVGWIALAAFALIPLLSGRLKPRAYAGGFSRDEAEQVLRNNSAIGMILGEVRTNLSDMLYIKTERYMHNGIAYKTHLDLDELAASGELKTRTDATELDEDREPHADEHDDDHEREYEVTTLVRSAADDFRGFIGYLERAVKPWQAEDEHMPHTSGAEVLPWYRLMTFSDPHNERAYLVGAWWLKSEVIGRPDEALKFIHEGIKNNPESFQLRVLEGTLYQNEFDDPRAANAAYRRAAEFALEARPEGGEESETWSHYEEDAALAAVRLAVLTEKESGDRQTALRLAVQYRDRLGADPVLDRQIEELRADAR